MGHASRADRTVLPTFSAGNQLEGDGGGSHTTNDAVATGVGENRAKTSLAAERLLQVRRSPHAEGLPPRQQTAASHCTHNGGKRRRSAAGVSFPATGSSISERAVSQTSADSDGQDGWTVVKRKRRGRKQAGGQSVTLAEDSRAKVEPRAPPQQPETETQPAELLSATQEVPPTSPTLQRHPSRHQSRKKRRMEQKLRRRSPLTR